MTNLVMLLAATATVAWLVQFIVALLYATRLMRSQPTPVTDRALPRLCVMMPLRGVDKCLSETLRRLFGQDHPNYEVRFVVDSVHDPAWDVVQAAARDRNTELREASCAGLPPPRGPCRVEVSALRERATNRSLFCSAVVQFYDALDSSVELINFTGGDDAHPPGWLREMATAMTDPRIGTTLGNRWFFPSRGQWGSMVRYVWGVGAVAPMWISQIPWSCASALRCADVKASGLAEKWRCSMADDAPVKSALAGLGLSLKFVPQLISVNRNEISLSHCCQFLRRQLFWTRLYHPHWRQIVAQAVIFSAVMAAGPVLAMVACFRSEWTLAAWAILIGALYLTVEFVLITMLERAVRRVMRSRGEAPARFSPRMLLRLIVAVPLTQLIHTATVIQCIFMRRVQWAGTWYEVEGPWNVRRLEDSVDQLSGATPDCSLMRE